MEVSNKREPMFLATDYLHTPESLRQIYEAARAKDAELIQMLVDALSFERDSVVSCMDSAAAMQAAASAGFKPTDDTTPQPAKVEGEPVTDEQLYADAMASVTPDALARMDKRIAAITPQPAKVLTDDHYRIIAERMVEEHRKYVDKLRAGYWADVAARKVASHLADFGYLAPALTQKP